METTEELKRKYIQWTSQPLKLLIDKAMSSSNGVASSRYTLGDRTKVLIVCVHPIIDPWKTQVQCYLDQQSGNHSSLLKDADFSLVVDNAFEFVSKGLYSSFVIYDIPVVILTAIDESHIAFLEEHFLLNA